MMISLKGATMKRSTVLGTLFTSLFLAGSLSPVFAGSSEMPRVGVLAQDFTLKDQDGKIVTLAAYRGKDLVILYFYPKDETPGCTREACTFREDLSWYQKNGVEVLGVSVDDVTSHNKFAGNHSLNFRILSDADKTVTKGYGVLGFLGLASRTTFVIDKQGVIRAVFTNVKVDGHSAELQKAIGGLLTKT